jgi:hypothetical protein
LYLKQYTDRLQRKQPNPLRFPPKTETLKKTRTTNQGRALTAATRVSLRKLGDIRRNPSRLVFAEQLGGNVCSTQ